MKQRYLLALTFSLSGLSGLVALTGCGGTTLTPTPSASVSKSEAAARLSSGEEQGDPCTTNRWYGDGTCDGFCPEHDTDCVPAGEPVVCAAFAEVSDGKCGRKDDDPCRSQDPDCTTAGGGSPPNPGNPSEPGHTDPDEPVYCAAISEVSNGQCDRAEGDACRFQDPDCAATGPATYDCDETHLRCLIFSAPCPTGRVHSVVQGCEGGCVLPSQCSPSQPVACPAIALAPDGVCSPQPSGPCQLTDPDCGSGGGTGGSADGGVACAEYLEPPNGVCTRDPKDPCIGQDPDCFRH